MANNWQKQNKQNLNKNINNINKINQSNQIKSNQILAYTTAMTRLEAVGVSIPNYA